MTPQDQAIRRFRANFAALLFVRHALHFLAAFAFVYGTAVLVLRAAGGVARLPLLWGLAGVPVVLVPALILARRRRPAAAVVRALLDQRGGCGGLLMAGAERPLGGWEGALPPVAPPRLAWRGGRAGGLFLAGAGFVVACFLLPDRLTNPDGPGLDVSREANRIARQIEVLKEETILDPVRATPCSRSSNRCAPRRRAQPGQDVGGAGSPDEPRQGSGAEGRRDGRTEGRADEQGGRGCPGAATGRPQAGRGEADQGDEGAGQAGREGGRGE